MRRIVKSLCAVVLLFVFSNAQSQCAECPAGAVQITGSASINEQNNAANYCVFGTWSGTIVNIAGNSTVTICSSATWNVSSNVTLQQNVTINNYGTINGPNIVFKIQGQTKLNNLSSGTINVKDFENQDATFNNAGSLIAEDIYLHGPTSNSGTIVSTANCGGNASTSCGFFIGNKGQPFNNTGVVNAVDANLSDGVIGGSGTFNVTGTLTISNNGGMTNNIFNVNNLNLQASANYNSGNFMISGILNCNNANVNTDMCFVDGGSFGSTCSGASSPVIACQIVPVTVVDFDVKRVDDYLVFNWETQSEINVSHYEILVSRDEANSFDILSTVASTGEVFYQDKTKSVKGSVLYFKLKSVDLDGSEDFHPKIVTLRQDMLSSYTIMPNPTSRDQGLSIVFDDEQSVMLSIYNMAGQQISTQYFKDTRTIDVNLQEIEQSGLYIVKIFTPSSVYTEEIFVR